MTDTSITAESLAAQIVREATIRLEEMGWKPVLESHAHALFDDDSIAVKARWKNGEWTIIGGVITCRYNLTAPDNEEVRADFTVGHGGDMAEDADRRIKDHILFQSRIRNGDGGYFPDS